ncbi:MAG TPA: hypothetical protein VG839_07815 [Asticcacaulis sp.]|nr:hypothetical protein [Asticcacaulis sp.]
MAVDGSVYPRTYQYGPFGKLGFGLLSLLFVLLGVGVAAAAFIPEWSAALKLNLNRGGQLFFLFLGFPVAAIGLAGLVGTLRGKLVFFADRLEYTGLLARRIVRKDEIIETRGFQRKYGQLSLTLVLKKRWYVTISDFGKADNDFYQWFGDIPNAEARVKMERDQALLANTVFGRTEEQREKAVNGQIQVINVLGLAAQGAGLWGVFFPRPYTICMAVLGAIPAFALLMALVSGGRWALTDDPKSGRISLGNWVIVPIGALFLRAVLDDHVIDWKMPLLYAAVATPALMALVAAIELRFNPKTAWIFAFLYFAYAWAGLIHVNYILDNAEPKVTALQVLDKSVSSGKYTTYDLKLPPWGPYTETADYSVSHRLYDRLHKGDKVCVYVYPGRLGWPDYDIDECPAQPEDGKP